MEPLEEISAFELFVRLKNIETAVAGLAVKTGIRAMLVEHLLETCEAIRHAPEYTDNCFALLTALLPQNEADQEGHDSPP